MNQSNPTLLAALRQLVPERPLRFAEALRIVELQANRLRQLLDVSSDELPDDTIDDIPRITVTQEPRLPVSGLTQWHNGRWVIATNDLEPWTRQRFSTVHELFHVINHTTKDALHPDDPIRAEQLADYFAGCVLMPKLLVKRYVGRGENSHQLAERFGVSLPAVAVRLSQLGVSEPVRRCAPPTTSYRRAVRPYQQSPEGVPA